MLAKASWCFCARAELLTLSVAYIVCVHIKMALSTGLCQTNRNLFRFPATHTPGPGPRTMDCLWSRIIVVLSQVSCLLYRAVSESDIPPILPFFGEPLRLRPKWWRIQHSSAAYGTVGHAGRITRHRIAVGYRSLSLSLSFSLYGIFYLKKSLPGFQTRNQAVAKIVDRTAKNCRGHVT